MNTKSIPNQYWLHEMNTKSILTQLLDSLFFFEIAFILSSYIVVIENQYIQTSLMVALTLFKGKDRAGAIYKSEVNITRSLRWQVWLKTHSKCLRQVCIVCFSQV